MSYNNHKSSNSSFSLIIVILAMFFIIGSCGIKNSNERYEVGTVTGKEVKRINTEDKYLIYTEDPNGEINVYEITDSMWQFRWNSADVYGGIKEGVTYEFTVVGSRSPFLSWYPNILEYKELINEVN